MTRKGKIGVAAVVVVALAIAGVVVAKRRGRELTEVTVEKVTRGELVSKVTANGRVEAQRKVDISSDVMGQIVNLAVREGDVVEKGTFLLQIDQTQLAATARGAQAGLEALFHERDGQRANLAEARTTFERVERSVRDELVPLSEVDRARAAMESAAAGLAAIERRIEQARANLAGAENTLGKTRIVSPMAGVVTRLAVEEGEVAVVGTMNNPGTNLLTVSDMSVVEAVLEVDETDVPQVRVGQRAKVTVDAWPDTPVDGTVTEVGASPIQVPSASGAATTQAISFEVKVQLRNPPENIRPGFSCSAEIVTDTRPSTLSVPIQALVVRDRQPAAAGEGESGGEAPGPQQAALRTEEAGDGGGDDGFGEGPGGTEEGVYLFDREAGKVRFTRVATGISGDTRVEILGGIDAGQEIVTGPFRALREIEDGSEVKLAEPVGKGKGGRRGGPGA